MILTIDRLQLAIFRQGRIPGHLASRDGSARDAGQKGSIPGCPGQSGTGGNPHRPLIICPKFLTNFSATFSPICTKSFPQISNTPLEEGDSKV